MDASVEMLFERLQSLSLSNLEPLPNATKLSSKLKALEQIVSKILPTLPIAARHWETNIEGEQLTQILSPLLTAVTQMETNIEAEQLTQMETYIDLPALGIALRQIESKREAEQLMQEVNKLADKLDNLLNKLQSEALLAVDRLRARSFSHKLMVGCFNPSFYTCLHLQKRLAKITVEFRRVEQGAIRFADSAEQLDYDPGKIYGREEDLRNILELLLSDDGGQPICAVLRIFGPPGMGKTTLARLVYDNARTKSYFGVRTWVDVPESFEVPHITQDLLHKLGIEIPSSDNMDLASLQGKLQEHLSNKRFLLVLDHAPVIDPAAWRTFIASLASAAAPGSRVLMTMTADANEQSFLEGSLPPYELKGLTVEDCWSLLKSVAFPGRNPNEYSHLESVAKEVVHKCEAMPRATKVLGRILQHKLDESAWNNVLKSGLWEVGGKISSGDSLFMRYDQLPAYLRRCFAYCSIFPEDYKVLKETLIQLWIAADLVQEHRGTTLETIAGRYLDELRKSFFLDSNEDDGISISTLVSGLAHNVSGPAYFHYKRDIYDDHRYYDHRSPENVLHMSSIYDVSMKFEDMWRYTNLRTLLFVCIPASSRAMHTDQVLPNDLFTHFPELRSLSLSGLPMQNLPDSIGNLRQLRFLDLSYTPIEKLPETTTTLYDLLTLKLNNCVYIAELPSMENLTKLRHLEISGSKKIKAMPRGMGKLIDLHSLSDFIVRDVNESLIQELRDLVHLSGKLTISGLQNVFNSLGAKEANLASKTDLRELILEWTAAFSEQRNEKVETEVLDYLKPCSNLEILSIICYGGTRFPEWISLSHKLVQVTLSNCRKCVSLPLLGQLPSIKTLSIEGLDEVKIIGAEFCGKVSQGAPPFPSLETLKFKNMPSWEEWSFGSVEFEGLPCLRLLKIERCPKLKEFKVPMKALELLTINECQELTAFSHENLPRLRELDIQYCSNLKEMPPSFPSLTKLRIWGCHELISLISNSHATNAICEEFPCLLELDIQKCTSLRELPQKFPLLEKLRIQSCKQLFKLSVFPKLQDLTLEECDKLMLGNEVEVSSLVSMVICQLPKFVYPRAQLLQCSSRLINLEISQCVNLEAITDEGEHGLPALSSLERWVIDGCPKLKQLPHIFSYLSSLKELIIMGCEALEFIPEMALPPVFKRLVVANCKHLKSLPPKIFSSQDIGLEFLEIYGCPSLVSLSEGKLPVSLRWLSVLDCINLKSLPAGLNRENTSLTSLKIRDCHSLENFPHYGLPCNIRSLSVMNCGNLKTMSDWGLDELECLKSFSFGGFPEMVNFIGAMLPESVGCLLLKGLPKIESLSGLLQNLHSLDILTIRDCPRLEILAEEKLPDSLSCLYISNCPILKQRCKSVEGLDWYRIDHIPRIEFDFQSIR